MDPSAGGASPGRPDSESQWSNNSPHLMSPASNASAGSSIPRRRSTAPTRSHFSRRSEDVTGGFRRREPVISGVDIRQETLSWTFRELSMAASRQSPLQQEPLAPASLDFSQDKINNQLASAGASSRSKPMVSQLSIHGNHLKMNDQFQRGVDVLENTPLLLDSPAVIHEESSLQPFPLFIDPNQLPLEGSRAQDRPPRSPKNNKVAQALALALKSLPAVILAVLLNMLDAMSYGVIIFPASSDIIPDTAAQSGISMFLASTFISQIVYTMGGSSFKGAVGSMMIEVMPFLHLISNTIETKMEGDPNPKAILASIMAAYALSCILTGLVFLTLGVFKLGDLIQFFPRHILVGCIGGIGVFLMTTGIEITSGIKPAFSMDVLTELFAPRQLKLWSSAIAVSLFLKILQYLAHHPLLIPLFYLLVPLIFYAIVIFIRIPMDELREEGWLFNITPKHGDAAVPFWEFWTYYDFTLVNWNAVFATLPTQLALSFFGTLHVPINIPALAVSTRQEVDTNKELVGHGISNMLAGFTGTCQNYLVYSNSLLYIRSGGDNRVSGFLLALATLGLWLKGGSIINFVPTVVVGSLIFHLGMDLIKESIFDTWSSGMHRLEYITILIIIAVMGFVGFTEGIVIGIILACVFFVVMYARRPLIRATYTGSQVRSTVHRLYRQQIFLDKVGNQTCILKLQGFIFFGTVNQCRCFGWTVIELVLSNAITVDNYIRTTLENNSSIRFLVMDFSLINGVDYSALESFQRINRRLFSHGIHMIFCGLKDESVTKLLDSILLDSEIETTMTHSFSTLNDALEWCENQLLSAYYRKAEPSQIIPGTFDAITFVVDPTPRGRQTDIAASWILKEYPSVAHSQSPHPVSTLLQAFSDAPIQNQAVFNILLGEIFEKKTFQKDSVLFEPDQPGNELYIIESGELVLTLPSVTEDNHVLETLLPGTMVGELEFFTRKPHFCKLICEKDSTVWLLRRDVFDKAFETNPQVLLQFMEMALSFDATRFYNISHHWKQLI